MKKNFADRLARLEQRTGPATEPKIIRVEYIDSDGAVAPGGYTIEIPSHGYEPRSHDRRSKGSEYQFSEGIFSM